MAAPLYETLFTEPGSGVVSVSVENGRHFAPGGPYEGRAIEIFPYAADLIVSMTARATDGNTVPLHISDLKSLESFFDPPLDSWMGQEITEDYIKKRVANHTPTAYQQLAGLLSLKSIWSLMRSDVTMAALDELAKNRINNKIHRRIRGAGNYLLRFPEQESSLSFTLIRQNTNID